MFFIPLLLFSLHGAILVTLVATAIGILHGIARGTGIVHTMNSCSSPQEVMLRTLSWRFADGILLLVLGGSLITVILRGGIT
jgi:tetrahydromethanopterin S-methyltransferase subunit C